MNTKGIALGVIGAVVIGAAGYLAGVEIAGNGPSAAITEAAIKDYLAANPELLAPATAEPVVVTALSDDQRSEVEGIIRNHLIANPEIISDAITELQRRQDEAEQAQQVAAIANNSNLLFSSSRQVVLGNPDARVSLVEFFDYNCGYCRRAHADMQQLLDDDDDLRIVLKEFPVLGDGSVEASRVSIAVRMVAPDKSADFFHALITTPGQVNGDRALAVAEDIGLDRDNLVEAMKSDEVTATIAESYDLASELALTGTPSYVTSNEVVVGAVGYDALKTKVAEARAACTETATC